MKQETAIIIGAGPAGLTAAYELLSRTSIKPVVLEKSAYMGGIARTVNYKGNRIDIGGHRFFSKSDRVMRWWLDVLPLQALPAEEHSIAYRQAATRVRGAPAGPDPAQEDRVMLLRRRRSRIYFLRKLFDYPIRLDPATLAKLGLIRSARIGASYLASAMFPIRDERNLEQFFINRFGRELYQTFFKSYTEKVWGVPCREIGAEWGAQRIKGLSVAKAVQHFLRSLMGRNGGLSQKGTETSLIEQFLYPKYGPGQMWETVAEKIRAGGGAILTGLDVDRIRTSGERVVAVEACDASTGERRVFEGDHFFSTMPIRDLVQAIDAPVPAEAASVAGGLLYRDFLTVGLLAGRLRIHEGRGPGSGLIRDNWVYIQEPDVQVGRMQVFNNWSPYMVADPGKVWLGLEYFCNGTDPIWTMPDRELIPFAAGELEKIGILDRRTVLDGTVIRMEKTYPAYFGSYGRFPVLREYLDRLENLYLVGRNGMHRYNNQDHSMLTAMVAVDNIAAGVRTKENIWQVNTEQEYQEGA